MPRFSANIGLLWPELALPQRILAASRAGFEAVEIHWPYDINPEDIRLALQKTGLKVLTLNTPHGDLDSGEFGLAAVPGRQLDARTDIGRAIDYARSIGAENVHVMAGTSGFDDDIEAVYLDNLAYAAASADQFDIGIIIEAINRVDRPGYCLHKIDQAIDILRQLRENRGRQNVGLMFDCYHVQITEGNLAERLKRALPYLTHIQIAAVPGRAEPDQGEINFVWLFEYLDRIGYQGYVGAEYLPANGTDNGLGWFQQYRSTVPNSTEQAIYRHFSRCQLDAEYNNIAKVADSKDHLHWYQTESRALRETMASNRDVAYGDSSAETLDIFYSNGERETRSGELRPVHVFFHGGYWRALDKDDFSYVARALADTDAICIVVNYGLIPGISMNQLIAQCQQSLLWIWRNIVSYGGDASRITTSGHSAGGHIVGMMMATDWPHLASNCPVDLVKAGVSISGLFDLEPIQRCFLNETLKLDNIQTIENSPVKKTNRCRCKLICFYGGLEGDEYRRQSEELAGKWGHTTAVELAIHNHFTIVRELNDSGSHIAKQIKQLI